MSGGEIFIRRVSGFVSRSDSVLEVGENGNNKDLGRYKCAIPRIVLASGREKSCVSKMFDSLKNKHTDVEEIGSLNTYFEKDIVGHVARGYAILDKNDQDKTIAVSESIDYHTGTRRPLWFVFSGMDSEWPGMGSDLTRIPTFATAIERCSTILQPKGLDIRKIITEPDKTIFNTILNAFVGISAVQIGLIDILKEIEIDPDYIIGHGFGEMACGYQDNTLTAEEFILASYGQGQAILETDLVTGSMATVDLGYKILVNQCPAQIDVACHNSSESSIISGPVEAMENFLEELTKRGIFAKKIPTANVAYHSKYVQNVDPALLRILRDVIKTPKLRSKKWISTSVPREQWDSETAQYSCPEYYTNNLLNPVLFEEVISLIPPNAVVVEIAPQGKLQEMLKRSHPECTHIPLTRRGCPDGVKFLLDGIGKLYEAGYNPKVNILYPKVGYPVSTDTPLISHLVKCERSKTSGKKITSSTRDLIISIHDDDYSYIADHIINGVITIPESTLLVYVWETLAMLKGVDFRNMSVIFEDIEFYGEVIVKPESTAKLSIVLNKDNNKFEIFQHDVLLVSGTARDARIVQFRHNITTQKDDLDDICLDFDDIYKIFHMRGYCYRKSFKMVHSINIDKCSAFVKFTNDWVIFLDALLQLNSLTRIHNGVSKVKYVKKLEISVLDQESTKKQFSVYGEYCYIAQMNKILGITRCAGVEIENITYADEPVITMEPDVLQYRSFFPYFATDAIDMKMGLEINIQVIAENVNSRNINFLIPTDLVHSEVFEDVDHIFNCLADVSIKIKTVDFAANGIHQFEIDKKQTNVFVQENLLGDLKAIKKYISLASEEDYVLVIESEAFKDTKFKDYFNVLTCMSNGEIVLMLLKKLNKTNLKTLCYPITMEEKFSWVSHVNEDLRSMKKLVLISERQPYSGLIGYVKKTKRDGYKNVALLSIHDTHAQPFDYNNDFYKNQIAKNLCVNILKKDQFGGYYYTSSNKRDQFLNVILKSTSTGDMEKISWVESPPCLSENNLVQVSFSGLSHRDCQKVTKYFNSNNDLFGMDFSGFDKNGTKVMGLVRGGAMSSTVEADPDLLWPVPDHWSLEDAATVPLPYVQAYYCLVIRRQIARGQRVLITGGAGALGQAVISLCTALDCVVFTTVSGSDKKKTLMRLFPRLNENNICYSDSEYLYKMVMRHTESNGCNIVINCATGSLREAAMKCVGFRGYFLDLSYHEFLENKDIGMSYLHKGRNYYAVDFSNIFRPEYASSKTILKQCLIDGIKKGVVKPITRVVYSLTMVSKAFRLLSTRRHRGRVLIKLRDPMVINQGLNVVPRLTYTPEDVVVIVCDEKCLGIELADKIVERGAKKIMVHMDPNRVRGYERFRFMSWSKRGVSLKLSSENLHSEQGCANLVKKAMELGKVKEVFFIQAGKRDDNAIDEMIYYNKCSVVLNLDAASRNCAELRHFTIVAHSIQNASDEYALSLSERVCELRNEIGLPALVIRCESLAELYESEALRDKVKPQPLSTFFNALERCLKMNYKNALTFNTTRGNFDWYKQVASILGVTNIKNLHSETTLQDLNVNEMSLCELRATIKNTLHIDYPIQKISGMTIKSLEDLFQSVHQSNTDFDCGIAVFYREVTKEEDYLLQEKIVSMSTLLNTYGEDVIDPNSPYIIMIPGFEGRPEILNGIAERLKIQAAGIQLGPDMAANTIREMAESIWKTLQYKLKSKFYILGYSFGVNIALELAAILEEKGQTGVVYCIDSSPDALRIHINAYLGHLSKEKLQDTILCHMMNLMMGEKSGNTLHDIEKLDTFEEKVEVCLKNLKHVLAFSNQYKRQLLESAYKRIKIAIEYNPEIKLQSELVLMKGIAHPDANLTDDYNLSKYSEKLVKVLNIGADHGLAHQDCRVSSIVNKFLDKNILEDFRKKFLCNI